MAKIETWDWQVITCSQRTHLAEPQLQLQSEESNDCYRTMCWGTDLNRLLSCRAVQTQKDSICLEKTI